MQSLSEKILKTQPPEDAPSMSPAIWRRGFRDGLRAAAALAEQWERAIIEDARKALEQPTNAKT